MHARARGETAHAHIAQVFSDESQAQLKAGAGSRRWASGTLPGVARDEYDERFVDRLSRQGEEALGRIAEELISNPVINSAIARAFEAREKAVQAQEVAMGALGIPSAADVERLTRRLRSVSQRLEGIEDSVDRLVERLERIEAGLDALDAEAKTEGGSGRWRWQG